MSVINTYIADRLAWGWGETTFASDAMLRQALGGRPVDMATEAPTDWQDLILCRQTYRHAPWALRRRMRPILAAFRTQLRERGKPGVRIVVGELRYSAEWLNDAVWANDHLPLGEWQRKAGDLLEEAIEELHREYPHPRLVTPTGDDHVTGLQPAGPAWSGKADGSIEPIRHETIWDAVAWMEEQEKADPDGFARGDYYVDSQEPGVPHDD